MLPVWAYGIEGLQSLEQKSCGCGDSGHKHVTVAMDVKKDCGWAWECPETVRVFFFLLRVLFCCGCGGAFFFLLRVRGRVFFLLRVRGARFFFCCGCGGAFFFVAGAVRAPFFLQRVRSVFAVFSIFYYENLYFL